MDLKAKDAEAAGSSRSAGIAGMAESEEDDERRVRGAGFAQKRAEEGVTAKERDEQAHWRMSPA